MLFWRDIANKLNYNTIFKLKLKFSQPIVSENKTETVYNKDTTYRNVNKNSTIISSIKILKKINYYEALSYFKSSLHFVIDNYLTFPVTNVILTYSICKDDSILKTLDISTQNFNSLEQNHKNNFIEAKSKLKLNDKILPLTTDLYQWGKIKITKGNYPYLFDGKETKLFIINDNIDSDFSYNYIVSIKGIDLGNKKVILHRVSVTDKSFMGIFINFIDIIYNPANPSSFVIIIKINLYVYEDRIRRLSLKRNKAKYFTALKICKSLSNKFITMDLETKIIIGHLEPYCVSIFDGKISYSFYITYFNSSEHMLESSIKFILKRKYNKHKIYLHNFSYFDGVFLMKIIRNIVSSNRIKPVIRDGCIINLRVEFGS